MCVCLSVYENEMGGISFSQERNKQQEMKRFMFIPPFTCLPYEWCMNNKCLANIKLTPIVTSDDGSV